MDEELSCFISNLNLYHNIVTDINLLLLSYLLTYNISYINVAGSTVSLSDSVQVFLGFLLTKTLVHAVVSRLCHQTAIQV